MTFRKADDFVLMYVELYPVSQVCNMCVYVCFSGILHLGREGVRCQKDGLNYTGHHLIE